MYKTRAHKTAQATAKAYAADQRKLARSPSTRMITLPRMVDTECGGSKEPHYLVYLTEAEIAFVMQYMAAKPTGAVGPQGTLCAPHDLPNSVLKNLTEEERKYLLEQDFNSIDYVPDYTKTPTGEPREHLTDEELKALDEYEEWYAKQEQQKKQHFLDLQQEEKDIEARWRMMIDSDPGYLATDGGDERRQEAGEGEQPDQGDGRYDSDSDVPSDYY